MKKYFYCADVGGSFIKLGIVDENANIVAKQSVKTNSVKQDSFANQIITGFLELEKFSGYKINDCSGVGVGCPGLIDSKNGILNFSGNLNLKNYNLKKELEKTFCVPVKIDNDADVATLAEFYFGNGKNENNFVLLTIGTGVGGGIVFNGLPFSKYLNYTCEIGHLKSYSKEKCSCGQIGCFETLASTKALVSQISKAIKTNKNSMLNNYYTPETVTAEAVFEYADKDSTARDVLDKYISYLGDLIVSLVNTFCSSLILIGGAISSQEKLLITPLEKYVNENIYARNAGHKVKIKSAKFKGYAGLIGGRCLFMEDDL